MEIIKIFTETVRLIVFLNAYLLLLSLFVPWFKAENNIGGAFLQKFAMYFSQPISKFTDKITRRHPLPFDLPLTILICLVYSIAVLLPKL